MKISGDRALNWADRVCNLLLGLSFFSWAILGYYTAGAGERLHPVRLTICALHLITGFLIVIRKSAISTADPWQNLLCLPSVIMAGIVFKLSLPLETWPLYSRLLFTAGGIWACTSFLFLGKNFAVLPSVRELTHKGPYALVRHPAYAGELCMLLACVISRLSPVLFLALAAAVPLLAIRIYTEEKILAEHEAYRLYRQKVPYRLVPGIW